MRVFTRKSFAEFLASLNGSVIMSLTIKTDASTKRGAPAIHEVKHCPVGMGWDYARKLAKAKGIPVEELGPLKETWHRPVSGALSRHRDDNPTQPGARLYARYYPQERGSTTQYELDGKLYSYREVSEHLKPPRSARDDATDEVVLRLAKLENIVGGVYEKEPFVVV
jgi:hypothetical protein